MNTQTTITTQTRIEREIEDAWAERAVQIAAQERMHAAVEATRDACERDGLEWNGLADVVAALGHLVGESGEALVARAREFCDIPRSHTYAHAA